ncbi:MAG: outer membrane beta-barrel protein, partial [Prevotella sp.]|nr:outer membrane beta-barrel protein [Prevotella sp.]
MRNKYLHILLLLCLCLTANAQERRVENRPYVDLRPFHFGVMVGTHLQDIEFTNVGPQLITLEDGTTTEKLVMCDQDRWDTGFTVGVLGEFRLHQHFQLRVAPA